MTYDTPSPYRSRSLYLLAALFFLILVSPAFEGTRVGHIVLDGLLCLVLLAAVNAVSDSRAIRITAFVLAILALLLMWANAAAGPLSPGRLAGMSIYIALIAATICMTLRRIILAPTVTFEVLCASVGIYLLIGVTWTLTYVVLDSINPSAFQAITPTLEKGWTEFLYFSFATLTTLGYGDISPDAPFVRIWAVMEAVIGVLYIAVLVARLVSLYRS
jgi:Ion channel